MSIYQKLDYEIGRDTSVLQCKPLTDKLVKVKPNLPGAVIVIHGVNDVGVSFGEVEQGLCAGLGERLDYKGRFQSADYRMPGDQGHEDDNSKVEPDPDAVFFKRQLKEGHHTPVIPFYWGYSEDYKRAGTQAGQRIDRYGNRLDKDLSKGGGPFANATNTLVDMWNRGFGAGPYDVVDRINQDPIRPVLKAPGRMYMILAAKRLAALISIIRDYDENEVVSLVAHSQGCMLSLLAQAFLMQRGLRPADTLVLTHPPYGLVDELPLVESIGEMFSGGDDAPMHSHYSSIRERQTLHARLQTLANIVQGVVEKKHAAPALAELSDAGIHRGMVGCEWKPGTDRDNRGKVYLYFCPEDMTVALNGMQGIGWQGVPDYINGQRVKNGPHGASGPHGQQDKPTETHTREALKELMAQNGKDKGFFQRVFTAHRRVAPGSSSQEPQPVLVGAAPQDFALRLKGEDDHGHAAQELDGHRAHSPEVDPQASTKYFGVIGKSVQTLREGIRLITGEALTTPVKADLYAGSIAGSAGKVETVDPIDAAISVTSRYGLQDVWLLVDDPAGATSTPVPSWRNSPNAELYKGEVVEANELKAQADAAVNASATQASQRRQIEDVYRCVKRPSAYLNPCPTGKLLVRAKESADEARLRQQQHGTSARSFHGAIFGSRLNHQQVTAYDIAIGGGKAVTDPLFYGYLCAVADWRLKKPRPNDPRRPGILTWQKFQEQFSVFYNSELDWRKALIEGNCTYYSTGNLPDCLPVLPAGLPPMVVSETMSGQHIAHPPEPSR